MSNGPSKGDDEDLLSELDAWDRTFDALHAEESGATEVADGAPQHGVPDEPDTGALVATAHVPRPAPRPAPRPTTPPPPRSSASASRAIAAAAAAAAAQAQADAARPAALRGASDERDFSDLDFDRAEALGELLGPPPLQPVSDDDSTGVRPIPPPSRPPSAGEWEDDAVYTSASRPRPPSLRAAPLLSLEAAPTDEELFGDLSVAPDEPAAIAAGFGGEATRIVDQDALLAEAALADDTDPGRSAARSDRTRLAMPEPSLLGAMATAAPSVTPSVTRGPAIVRRDDLERRRRGAEAEVDDGGGDFASGESTRIADLGQLEEMVHGMARPESAAATSAAAAFFADPAPTVELSVEDDFYEGIEIAGGEGDAPAAAPDLIAAVSGEIDVEASAPLGQSRRRTAHVVRRPQAGVGSGRVEAAVVIGPEAAIPTGADRSRLGGDDDEDGDGEVVLEIESDSDAVAAAPTAASSTAGPATDPLDELGFADFEDDAPAFAPAGERARRATGGVGRGTSEPALRGRRGSESGRVAQIGEPAPPSSLSEALGSLDVDEVRAARSGRQPLASAVAVPAPVVGTALAPISRLDLDEPDRDDEPAGDEGDRTPVPGSERELAASDDPDAAAAGAGAGAGAAATLVAVDVAPELPPSKFPTSEPALALDALALPERAPAGDDRADIADRSALLATYERELALSDDPVLELELRLEAGRIAESLGELVQARAHYEAGLALDASSTTALRALRRVARAAGQAAAAVTYLDAELALAAPLERRALAEHRVDLLMAAGEQGLARAAVRELLDEVPTDPRALLAQLELAFVDGRPDELGAALERLAAALTDPGVRAALHVARGHLHERGADHVLARDSYAAAIAAMPDDHGALHGAARVALATGAHADRDAALAQLADGPVAVHDPGYAAALSWRRAIGASPEIRQAALARAVELSPEPALLAAYAEQAAGSASAPQAAILLANGAPTAAERAGAAARAADRLGGAIGARLEAGDTEGAESLRGIRVDALRAAISLDPADALSRAALRQSLLDGGDLDGAIDVDESWLHWLADVGAAGDGATAHARARSARALLQAGRADEAAAALGWPPGRDEGVLAGPAPAVAELLDAALVAGGRPAAQVAMWTGIAAGVDVLTSRLAIARAASSAALAIAVDAADPSVRPRAFAVALDAWSKVLEQDGEVSEAHPAALRLAEALDDADVIDDVLARAQDAARSPTQRVAIALRRARALGGVDPGRAEELLHGLLAADAADPRLTAAALTLAARTGRLADAALVLEDRAAALAAAADAAAVRPAGRPAGRPAAAASVPTAGEALASRYRAAGLLLERGDEPARAVELLAQVVEAMPALAPAADLLAAARRRSGEAAPTTAAMPVVGGAGRAGADSFARLVREAEASLLAGDAARAVDVFALALELRPADPLAREGLGRAATQARTPALLAALALGDLRQAEELGDDGAKAAAWEELARIDGELRGDAASAMLGWESASDADPSRLAVVRQLERACLRDDRRVDLLRLYDRQIAPHLAALSASPDDQGAASAPAADPDLAALALVRAQLTERLAERLDQPEGELRLAYQRVLTIDPLSRPALFHLELMVRRQLAAAAGAGDDPAAARAEAGAALAVLEEAIAAYFEGDTRSRAAFLTRAGETLAELGQLEAAIERFRAADAVSPGHSPALQGWLWAALRGQLWLDVADAAQREAAVAATDDERARLLHLAGVTLMDRALAGERAVPALRRVLTVDPAHRDAFVRLRILFDEQGQHEDLAQLLAQRLEHEGELTARIDLHRSLAALHRNFLDDRATAKLHLRELLALDSNDLRAIAELANICWEQGSWAEAAEALMGWARLERDAAHLRTIYYRLGVIYAERLPQPEWAIRSFHRVLTHDADDPDALDYLARLGIQVRDWKMALGACERLVKGSRVETVRVENLHRAGHIYLEGFQDRARAERAFRLALDLAPTSDVALQALVRFYGDAGDTGSARVHLDRVAQAMRSRLETNPLDGVAFHVLARALAARQHAGVAGSLAAARCAAELAVFAGGADEFDRELAAPGPPVRLVNLVRPDVDDVLFPRTVPAELRQLFALLGERVAKHVGVDIRAHGVSRSDRLRRGHAGPYEAAVAIALEAAEDLGLGEIDVFVSERLPLAAFAEPTAPVSLILGTAFAQPGHLVGTRFAVGRALKLAQAQLAIPARLAADDLGVLLVALLRLFHPDMQYLAVDPDAVVQQVQRLRRLIPSGLLQELRPYALGVVGAGFDHRSAWAGIQQAGNRAGLVACGSIQVAALAAGAMHGRADLAAVAADPLLGDLVRFAVSEDHVAVRGMLE